MPDASTPRALRATAGFDPIVEPQSAGFAAVGSTFPPETKSVRFCRTDVTRSFVVGIVTPHEPTWSDPLASMTAEAAPVTKGLTTVPSTITPPFASAFLKPPLNAAINKLSS